MKKFDFDTCTDPPELETFILPIFAPQIIPATAWESSCAKTYARTGRGRKHQTIPKKTNPAPQLATAYTPPAPEPAENGTARDAAAPHAAGSIAMPAIKRRNRTSDVQSSWMNTISPG